MHMRGDRIKASAFLIDPHWLEATLTADTSTLVACFAVLSRSVDKTSLFHSLYGSPISTNLVSPRAKLLLDN
jgi:hypothetical protein